MAFFFVFASCKTNKNTFIHRGYHNLTARYNGYYYSTESIKEAVDKIEKGNKEDYDQILPVYITPSNENAKATFPEFDKAIKKSSLVIQRHTIHDKKGNEIFSAGKWIDNNWINIGISNYYKREFFSGIEAFDFVMRSYRSKDRFTAMIWLARSYNEIGAVSQAEPVITLLSNEKGISKSAKKELSVLKADYDIKRGRYEEAEKNLLEAVNSGNKFQLFFQPKERKRKARYSFILGQLYEQNANRTKANQYYKKCIDYKPSYDMVFNAQIKMARLYDLKKGNSSKLKRNLLKMTNDIKNKEYLDIIYYTLGEIEEKEKNTDMAVTYYKKSVQNSTVNPKQKALSYLRLGEISFEEDQYTASGAYYDSTMITLPKDYKDYESISNRKKVLETLVGYIRVIEREDSLQKIAKMSENDRNSFIDRLIKKIEDDEEKKKEQQELNALQNQNPNYNSNNPQNNLPSGDGGTGDWYFYNPTTVSFGVNDFVKKWGNRKLEDNWRRSQKGLGFDNNDTDTSGISADNNSTKTKGAKGTKSREYYLKDLPMNDSLLTASNSKIIEAYYNLGSIYKEELKNNKRAVSAFEELNKRFLENKYKLSVYYQLYKLYQLMKNQSQSDYYKNLLLDKYPNSEYAQIIKNPNYGAEKMAQKGEVELFYTNVFNDYSAGNYNEAYNKCKESEIKFGKNEFSPKFAFIKAMCIGKFKGIDSLEIALKTVQVLYPKDPVTNQAQQLLTVIYDLKHPESNDPSTPNKPVVSTDTFNLNLDAEHFVIAVLPDDQNISTPFKSSLTDFNTQYYSNNSLTFTGNLFGVNSQMIVIKRFKNAGAALSYIQNLSTDDTVFSGPVKKESVTLLAISEENLPVFYKKKKVENYLPFYHDHYKSEK